jgi:arylsulfatase A-like enzyme
MRFPVVACFFAFLIVGDMSGAPATARADAPQRGSGERRRPNILFILTDDQSYKTVGCYPEAPAWVRTPHLDRLAGAGVRFERAYLGAWCMPARASLLTGKLQHGIESMRMAGAYPGSTYDPAACPFLPAEFRRQGYQTAHIGKWHTGTDSGFGRDWDYQVVWNRPKLPANAGAYYQGQILAFDGEERRVDGYSTDVYTDLACDYIRGGHRAADKPWFLWLCYGAVHGPTTPAPRHAGALAGHVAAVPADIFGPRPGKPAYLDATQAWDRGPDGLPVMRRRGKSVTNFDANLPGRSHADWVRQVNECAMAIDEGVGRLLESLEESGQLADTLVVFTSDQGFALGEHGLSMKLAPYDAAIASPLIVSRPGTVPGGEVRCRPVNAADIAVTLCGAAAVEIPWPTHGRDFGSLLTDAAEPAPPPMLLTNTGRSYGADTATLPVGDAMFEQSGVPWWVMLRDGRHKYVRTLVAGEVEEVYDLAADPEELENLAVDAARRPLLEQLRATALAELRRTGAGFVATLPEAGQQAGASRDQRPANGKP